MQELLVGHLTLASGGGLDDAARAEGQAAIRTAFAAVLAILWLMLTRPAIALPFL